MKEGVKTVSDGSLGFFWPVASGVADIDADPESGYVRIDGDTAIIDVLEPDADAAWIRADDDVPPRAVVSIMPEEAALFLEVWGPFHTRRMGVRACSTQYRARTIVGGFDVTALRTCDPIALCAHFHGISRWAGLTTTNESSENHATGLLKSWTIAVGGADEQSVLLPGSRTLTLSATWAVDGPEDQRVVSAPVSIGCSAKRPRSTWDLLQPLLLVQDLLNLAFAGFVLASPGTAAMKVKPNDRRFGDVPWFWNGALMTAPQASIAPTMRDFPLFDLSDLGGASALRRWVSLASTHPRAVAPITTPYRHGPRSAPVTMLETAAGIEYWVRSCQPAKWTTAGKWAQALARHVGPAFGAWVGDTEAWAKEFWETNNALKHQATYVPDHAGLTDLALSGRYLLTAALLNRVAGSKGPSQHVFRSHRTVALGHRLKERFS